jgi:uncharacterized protein (TIGR02145 family)
MKKNLLLMMLCIPAVLAAQGNGVTVSSLVVNAGTVTFNVSWEKPMPVALWSDTVWVFVDYNKNGVMERLPLLPGATLTATSLGGKVIEETDNNKGVWVVGNARINSSFSATVKLLTAVKDVGGACVYGSNYPPVGEYTSATEISFIGTPQYDLVLEKIADGSTYTISTTGLYSIHAGEVIQSFTDATGAPGIMKCIPMTGNLDFVVPAVSKNHQASFVVSSEPDVPDPSSITYHWSAPYFSPTTYEGITFTSTTPETPDMYSVTLTAQSEGYCNFAITKDVEVSDCTTPGSTVNFTAFNPCSNATTGDYWFLTDTRESNNVQSYKVKLMADGHIWMVQDMKFGDKCNKETFTGSNGKDQTGNVTTLKDKEYYGDCTNLRDNSTPVGRGYLYDWAAVINKSGAYYGSNSNVGCSGTGSSANACQGICPVNWHVPTGGSGSEQYALCSALGCGVTYLCPCLLDPSGFEGVIGGGYERSWISSGSVYSSSTYVGPKLAYVTCFPTTISICDDHEIYKDSMIPLRCVMNY